MDECTVGKKIFVGKIWLIVTDEANGVKPQPFSCFTVSIYIYIYIYGEEKLMN